MRKVDGFGTASLPNDHFYELNKVAVEEMFFPRYYAVFFNPKATSILKEKDFRRVLSDSLNRKELVENIFQGKAQEFNTLSDFINKEKSQPLDKEEARSVISELKGDKELTLEIVIPEVSFLKETANFIKEKWEELGIDNVSIVSLKSDDFTNAVIRERSYEAVIFGNVLENDLDLFPFWHSSERFYPGLNLSFYSNENLDTILENIRTYEDPEKRLEEFSKAAELIKEDYPAAFLYTLPYFYIHHERLFGLDPSRRIVNPNDRFDNAADWYVNRARVMLTPENTTSTPSS
jgi:ABC-type transport system substrate-binding protein